MNNVEYKAIQYRNLLVSGNDKAMAELADAYSKTWLKLKPQLDKITDKYWKARQSGADISPNWLFQQEHYRELMLQCENELIKLANKGVPIVNEQVSKAITLGEQHAKQLTFDSLGAIPNVIKSAGLGVSYNKLPKAAIEKIVGFLQDGSPIDKVLKRYGVEAAQGIKDTLITGISMGKNPNVISRELKLAYGKSLYNVDTLCRTETMRTYRSVQLDSYKANPNVVERWIWHSDKGSRTCISCIFQHGTEHELSEDLQDHVKGRCSRVPRTKTWQQLFPDLDLKNVPETPNIETGVEKFTKLSDKKQQDILGKPRFDAIKTGKIDYKDLISVNRDTNFGNSTAITTLKDLNL